jgi:hypothetical protein
MTIVLANPRCQGVLQAVLPSSDGNIRMARLPRDCSVAAQAPGHKIAPGRSTHSTSTMRIGPLRER